MSNEVVQLYEHKTTGQVGYLVGTFSCGEWCNFKPLLLADGSYIEMPTNRLRGLSRQLTEEEHQRAVDKGITSVMIAEHIVTKETVAAFALRTIQSIVGLLAALVALSMIILIVWHALGLTIEMAVSAGVVLSIGCLVLWGLSGLFSNGFSGRRVTRR